MTTERFSELKREALELAAPMRAARDAADKSRILELHSRWTNLLADMVGQASPGELREFAEEFAARYGLVSPRLLGSEKLHQPRCRFKPRGVSGFH